MLDGDGACVARAADRRGHIGRQNQVRVVAANGNACAGGGVVRERCRQGIAISDREADRCFGGYTAFDIVGSIWQGGDNAWGVVALHQQVQAAGYRPDKVVSRGHTHAEHIGCYCARCQCAAAAVGVHIAGIGGIAEIQQVGLDSGLVTGKGNRLVAGGKGHGYAIGAGGRCHAEIQRAKLGRKCQRDRQRVIVGIHSVCDCTKLTEIRTIKGQAGAHVGGLRAGV